MKYPLHLSKLIDVLKTLPGVGKKSAERYAFHLIDLPEHKLKEMGEVIASIHEKIKKCQECGCLVDDDECKLCNSQLRQQHTICVISSPKDALTIEMTNQYKGLYHVLGGVLSPLDGKGPSSLRIQELIDRLQKYESTEVVIALDSTLEGDATALYLADRLNSLDLRITRLASGLPMGSTLDFVDGGTLAYALSARSEINFKRL